MIVGYADDTLDLSKAKLIHTAITRNNMQISKILRRVTRLGLKIAEHKTSAIIFNGKLIRNHVYKIRVNYEEITVQDNIKYLGLTYSIKIGAFWITSNTLKRKCLGSSGLLIALCPILGDPARKRGNYTSTRSVP